MAIEEPHDMGKMILSLQDQLNTIKEKIKGLDTGYLPQLPGITNQMERVQSNLKIQSEQLLQKLLTGDTVQDISNKPVVKKSTLSAAGELHVRPPNQVYVRKNRGKKSTSVKTRKKAEDEEEVACITENDISKGLFNLMNKGIIPKDVDLTPAFVRGAPPLSNKAISIYPGTMKPSQVFIRSDNSAHSVKFDFSYNEPKKSTLNVLRQTKAATVDMMFGERIKEDYEETRGYDELMDAFSSHLFIIRKGVTLDSTPEFISFQRTYFQL